MSTKPFVIAVSGISGGGKTTVVGALSKVLQNTVVISFDSYDDMLHKDFFDWSDRGGDYNEWDLSPMINDLQKEIEEEPKYIILDYPFGYGNIQMARRIIRDYTERSADRNKIDNIFDNLNAEMKVYLNHGRMVYTQHIDTVKPYCDFVVDGTKNIENITNEIVIAVSEPDILFD